MPLRLESRQLGTGVSDNGARTSPPKDVSKGCSVFLEAKEVDAPALVASDQFVITGEYTRIAPRHRR